MISLLDASALGEWKNQAEQIENAMNDYWRNSDRSRNQPRLQTPHVWWVLRHKLADLLQMSEDKAPRLPILTEFERFLLHAATHLYEVGWQEHAHPHWPYEKYYIRSGNMIRESITGKYRFGLPHRDQTTIEILAQLCTLVGRTTLVDLHNPSTRAQLPWDPEEVRMDYMVALLQLADRLFIDRANDMYITPLYCPDNIIDARLTLALPVGSPYITRIKTTECTLTSIVSLHPEDPLPRAQKIKDLFLEPIRQWITTNGKWMAERYHFRLTLNEPESGPANHVPLATTCPALLPFLDTFTPTDFQTDPPPAEDHSSKSDPSSRETSRQESIILRQQEQPKPTRTKAIICYSSKDRRHLERLQTHLAYYQQLGLVDLWDTTKITPGSLWEKEIPKAVASAKVAILLISADFLASTFIIKDQLAPLLVAAKAEKATILPVLLSASPFEKSGLKQFQPVNANKFIAEMGKNEREANWQKVADMAYTALVPETQNPEMPAEEAEALPLQEQHTAIETTHTMISPSAIGPQKDSSEHQVHFTIQVGQKLWDQYEVRHIAGTTNHSQVVKAWDEILHREVAIKFFYLSQTGNEALVKQLQSRLLREARILARLEHRHIGRVYAARAGSPAPAIIMQWVAGKSLEDLFAEDAEMPISQVLRVGIILAEVLHYIHGLGIVHRDIKPNNILLDEVNNPILIDFDIARAYQFETITRQSDGTSVYVGNAPYCAPEQFVSPETVGPPTDIFALGLVLYEALTHQRPFIWGSNPTNYRGRLPVPEPDVIPTEIYQLLCSLLRQTPDERPDALQLQEQLQTMLRKIERQNT